MKRKLLAFLLVPGIALASQSVFDNNTWFLDQYSVSTHQHEPFKFDGRVYDYSLEYTTPSGTRSNTDACALSSLTTLTCLGGDSLVYNQGEHSVALTAKWNGTFTYYEKNYMPKGSPLSGTWRKENKGFMNCSDDATSVVIPYHDKDAKTFKDIKFYSDHGFHVANDYYLVKDQDSGQLALSPVRDKVYRNSYYYLYDINNKPIYDVERLSILAKLNNARKFEPQCSFVKS